MSRRTLEWGKIRYAESFKDDSFMHTETSRNLTISSDYEYVYKNPVKRFFSDAFYYVIAVPFLSLLLKIKLGIKVKGRKNLKKLKSGAIIIGNHSQPLDCLISAFSAFPKRNYIVSNKDAVNVKGLGKYFTKALGALPLPDENRGLVNLSNAIDQLVKKGKTVTIYPEAAIWPYHTKLRPLEAANFHYAVKSSVPVVPVCVTYRYAKGRNYLRKKPKVNVTISEPIYPDVSLAVKDAKTDLRDRTEAAMKAVIETPDNVALYEYRIANGSEQTRG